MTLNTFSVQFILKQDKLDNGGLVPIYAKLFINGSKIELSTFQKNKSHSLGQEQKTNKTNSENSNRN